MSNPFDLPFETDDTTVSMSNECFWFLESLKDRQRLSENPDREDTSNL